MQTKFKKGDKVFNFRRGNGVVERTDYSDYPIIVEFHPTQGFVSFTSGGREIDSDMAHSLFHGHDLSVQEVTPVRTVRRFVNLWINHDGDHNFSTNYKASPEEAKEYAESCKGVNYIAIAVPVDIPEDLL